MLLMAYVMGESSSGTGCMGPTEEGDPLARDAHTGYPNARSPTRCQTVLFKQTEEGDAH